MVIDGIFYKDKIRFMRDANSNTSDHRKLPCYLEIVYAVVETAAKRPLNQPISLSLYINANCLSSEVYCEMNWWVILLSGFDEIGHIFLFVAPHSQNPERYKSYF